MRKCKSCGKREAIYLVQYVASDKPSIYTPGVRRPHPCSGRRYRRESNSAILGNASKHRGEQSPQGVTP
jgi:hypothetical protein